jgi:hypothetical protein
MQIWPKISFIERNDEKKSFISALDMAVEQRDYLTSINRGIFYYEQCIDALCKAGGVQHKTPDAC